MENIASLHEDTLKLANESRVMAKATYLEALAISTDASSIAIPPIDAAELRTEGECLSTAWQWISAYSFRLTYSCKFKAPH